MMHSLQLHACTRSLRQRLLRASLHTLTEQAVLTLDDFRVVDGALRRPTQLLVYNLVLEVGCGSQDSVQILYSRI